jgi:RNA polymerase sigma factor (sigma-70 family)
MRAEASVEGFELHRRRLFSIAYRMLGSAMEAEDVVQDSFLRLVAAADVRDREAFLVRVVTRLCLDRLGSARMRREAYVGPWLPEPVLTRAQPAAPAAPADPAETVEREESVALAALLLLERLTPAERAVHVLHDGFGYGYGEVGAILAFSEDRCRQLQHRARQHLADDRVRASATRTQQERLTRRLLAAARAGDVAGLEALLAHDVVLCTDGGGRAKAALRPVAGRAAVARFLVGVSAGAGGVSVDVAPVNGGVGLVATAAGQVTHVGVVDAAVVGGVEVARQIMVVANPDKLRYIDRQLTRPA